MKKTWWIWIGVAVVAVIALIAVIGNDKESAQPTNQADTNDNGQTGIANPAAVYCEQQGGKSEIVTAEDGSQSGICTLKDGIMCDEWEYYRGDCGCVTDSDCVKEDCCHAKSCILADRAPSCKGIMCTQECTPDTLDCGGSCKCTDNQCEGIGIFEESE